MTGLAFTEFIAIYYILLYFEFFSNIDKILLPDRIQLPKSRKNLNFFSCLSWTNSARSLLSSKPNYLIFI